LRRPSAVLSITTPSSIAAKIPPISHQLTSKSDEGVDDTVGEREEGAGEEDGVNVGTAALLVAGGGAVDSAARSA
jgi:hypothetical protein